MSELTTISPDITTPAINYAQVVSHVAHLLPSQGPITVFVHHNTLHAYEEQDFHRALLHGSSTYECEPYMSTSWFQERVRDGRISLDDLSNALIEDLGADSDDLIGFLGTRFHLRLGMLRSSLRVASDDELRWLIEESNVLKEFHPDCSKEQRRSLVEQTRRWISSSGVDSLTDGLEPAAQMLRTVTETFPKLLDPDTSTKELDAFCLQLLWELCLEGVSRDCPENGSKRLPIRHRDLLVGLDGEDIDPLVNGLLIRFCAAFVDQGYAKWTMPDREHGFYRCFLELFHLSPPRAPWLKSLQRELDRLIRDDVSPEECIAESLQELDVPLDAQEAYISATLMVLRGWAGMIWQLETNADWTIWPSPRGTLVEYVAIRLLLERLALRWASAKIGEDPARLRSRYCTRHGDDPSHADRFLRQAFQMFQLAQLEGWAPPELYRLTPKEWRLVLSEVEMFTDVEQRRVFHEAYEGHARKRTLGALVRHGERVTESTTVPSFQLVCCIDEREESFRRHVEEVEPSCETFGVAGFFGVAMYYRGAGDAHYVPLCPVVVKPQHYVQEEVVYSLQNLGRARAETRRVLGQATHRWHTGSRGFLWGILTAILGSLASIPLVMRVLFPRLTAQIRRMFGKLVQAPAVTQLVLERIDPEPGSEPGQIGYSLDERVDIVERLLRDIGLTRHFSRVVVIAGHGSASLNNPHEAAHDCGACGGGRGGPNARAFAQMANDLRVRRRLVERGLHISAESIFVGAYHNTCDDAMTYYDLDALPRTHRADFEHIQQQLDSARARNAHERCRRFQSASLGLSVDAALRHVEARAEDLSQVRPEYGHATNAYCLVGRRWRTRGLFFDRRAFLTSYDPTQDDEECSILSRILQAVIPVCAGINLEYYFSFVDSRGYGCGTKLPHNVTSLVGVMDGAESDLRPGLPWQMVEVHEPIRILFVIESTPDAFVQIMMRNPVIETLVVNRWIQVATLDPDSLDVHVFRRGHFESFDGSVEELAIVTSSADWYADTRDFLDFASIDSAAAEPVAQEVAE